MNIEGSTRLLRTFTAMVARGDSKGIGSALRRRLYSTEHNFVLRRDLTIPFTTPPAKLAVQVRPLCRLDIDKILLERPRRLRQLEAGISTCYVGVTGDGDICYMQWLIDASQNQALRDLFGDCRPLLKTDEMLLEWAYTFEKYRGRAIMAHAMSRISEQAIGSARWLITYVNEHNQASLRGCRNAGYRPFLIQTQSWRLFRCRAIVQPTATDAKFPFELERTGPSKGLG